MYSTLITKTLLSGVVMKSFYDLITSDDSMDYFTVFGIFNYFMTIFISQTILLKKTERFKLDKNMVYTYMLSYFFNGLVYVPNQMEISQTLLSNCRIWMYMINLYIVHNSAVVNKNEYNFVNRKVDHYSDTDTQNKWETVSV
jgi:hypothetical protein